MFDVCEGSIISELEWRNNALENGVSLPIPTYLFVRNYGRAPYNSIEEIAKLYGDDDYIYLNVTAKPGGSIINEFQVEVEKHKKMGKEFAGFIHIELDDSVDENEYIQFFRYLHEKEDKYHYLFSIGTGCDENYIFNLLEQFFFTRLKAGEEYTVEEQLDIAVDTLASLNVKLPDEAIAEIENKLSKHKWDAKENVQNKIESIISNGVYNYTLSRNKIEYFMKEFDRLTKRCVNQVGFAYVE